MAGGCIDAGSDGEGKFDLNTRRSTPIHLHQLPCSQSCRHCPYAFTTYYRRREEINCNYIIAIFDAVSMHATDGNRQRRPSLKQTPLSCILVLFSALHGTSLVAWLGWDRGRLEQWEKASGSLLLQLKPPGPRRVGDSPTISKPPKKPLDNGRRLSIRPEGSHERP